MDDQNLKNTEPKTETELEKSKKQSEEYLNNWKRERADFINYKKDEAKRMMEFVKFGNESLILELVEVLDDLYLAADEVKNSGLDQVLKKFQDLLKKYGVERIQTDGPFNPELHEAVAIGGDPVKSPEGDNGASKLEEIRAGYTMYGRVIRPSRVKIIK